mgnify:CR=1 FL=1
MSKKDDDKVFAFLGAFIPIIGFIIVLLAKKDSKLAMYHAKQGLVLGIVAIIVSVIASIFVRGFLFFGFFGIIFSLINLLLIVLWIIGWINALSEKEKPLPVIGQYAKLIKV